MSSLFFVIVSFLVLSSQVYASTSLMVAYDTVKDNYMVAYYKQIPDRPSSFVVKFVNPSNSAANAQKTFFGNDVSGIFYLTCNGQYTFEFYDSGGVLKNTSQLITTTLVKGNLCSSFPNPTDQYAGAQLPKNENNISLGKQSTPEGEKTYLYWHATDCPYGTQYYDIYRDGTLVTEMVDSQLFQYPITGDPGLWRVENLGCGPDNKVGEIPYSPASDTSGVLTDAWAGVPPSGNGTSPTGPIVPPDPNAPVTNGSLDTALNNCGTLICDCIKSLQPSLDVIASNTGGILGKIPDVITAINAVKDSVDTVNTSLLKVNDSVQEVKDQLKPVKDYPVKQISDYPAPTLDDNKPIIHDTGKFTDTNTYFTDSGDAPAPDPLPVAPEPVTEWKDSSGNVVSKQNAISRDLVKVKEPNIVRDSVQSKSPSMQRDSIKTKSPSLNRTPVMTRDEINYPLRWNSSDYHGG
jgi:hypothetical protein